MESANINLSEFSLTYNHNNNIRNVFTINTLVTKTKSLKSHIIRITPLTTFHNKLSVIMKTTDC